MNNSPVICEHPQFILSPLCAELVSKYRNFYLDGVRHDIHYKKSVLYGKIPLEITRFKDRVNLENFCRCFVSDDVNQVTYPLFLQVPCGTCEVCKHKKMTSFVQRCKLETQLYNSKPLFLTLTYDEFNKKECGVCLRDVQLFFKRLRINLHRRGYRQKVRYALVAEYGSHTYRPHYHCILWNLHQSDILTYREIRDVIEKSWSNGFVYLRQIEPRNDKAFYYTSKYLCKDSHIPSGCNKTFMVCSNRGGGIGSQFIYRLREHVKRTFDTKLKFVNKWSNTVSDIHINSYILNKLFPSFSRSVPYSIKKRVRRFVLYYNHLLDEYPDDISILSFKSTYNVVMRVFPKYMYIEPIRNMSFTYVNLPRNVVIRQLLDDMEKIDRVLKLDLNKFYELDKFREPYVNLLLQYTRDVDVSFLSYKYRREREYSKQYEVL